MAHVWLEAESFEHLGGWQIDPQSMRQMGSAYVMAHGLGRPVADATTTIVIPEAGEWTLWARTRDWTAPWGRGSAAGRFQVLINGVALPQELGTNGAQWSWQLAGKVALPAGPARLALHDLTGFNARCDALYLSNDPADQPEQDPAKLPAFRRAKAGVLIEDDTREYDLAVAGGGIAGICTAIAALRSGASVLLVQDRGVLGGCNSSEVRVGLGGFAHAEPYPKLGNVVTEIAPVFGGPGTYPANRYEDDRKRNIFLLQNPKTYTLALNESVVAVEKDPADPTRLAAIITRSTISGKEKRYRAKNFADCTGDAVLARLMGARTMYGRDGKEEFRENLAPAQPSRQVMGQSVQWYSEPCAEGEGDFPDIDWGLEFSEDKAYFVNGGDWEWESGQYRDQAEETEYIRDYGLMTIFANWSYVKNHSSRKGEWARRRLAWASPCGGKRESYRVVGDIILTQNDIEDRRIYPDATGAMTWNIDLHFPDPQNEALFPEPFRSCAYHRDIGASYPVPYRCLYAGDVSNLFLGGRHISMSHVAFSCARVMRTLGILGEVIGMAAALCARHGCTPRDIYAKHFDELKEMMRQGVPQPVYHAYPCGERETYHFKEIGHVRIYPGKPNVPITPELRERIRALGMVHKHGVPELES
ncbi:MAG: FAD-dependent oxidoreductase [Lentisphaeria bacterium]|jgi:hypothetical protein